MKHHNIKLNTERMEGNQAGTAAREGLGFQPNYLHGLDDLCRKFITPDSVVLEIGSHKGVSTSLFCAYAKHVYSVDMQSKEELKTLIENSKNLTFTQLKSQEFLAKCKDKYDLIYIDGNHMYDGCCRDIISSIPLLKDSNSILSGHDMNPINPGVLQAVSEIFPNIKNGEIILHRFSDSSWAISARDIHSFGYNSCHG